MKIICALAAALLLAGCQTDGVGPTTRAPICDALGKPLRYNTYKITSGRYAGKELALDLHQRNLVGQNLGCRGF